MSMPYEISELIERFDRNREAYLSGQYNETQLRREFLDPLFMSLGWDVDNKQGYAEAYKDVIHEDAIKIGGVIKAPDYCFRIGGTKKFFVEAKKPSVKLKDDISPAFQLRRYAWSAKLPLSILTDFEEFAVYDCRVKPVKTDKASTARILYLTYNEFSQRWDEISSVFSRDSVLKGSFDKYAGKGKHKKGTAEVDNAFLEEIEIWRDMFARNIALRNPGLTQRELNFAVQRIIDRIIFLRICEDRGIEEYGRLMSLLNGVNVYRRLFQIFRNADERYNSGLFHFEKEKDRHELPDDLTPSLDIDDKLLKDIIRRLYYPESPYEFSVLPADILGQVYEQFLGKVIRLTSGHRAIVEEKPEVRKAGGVYYTPTYIVDYIVKNTVGHLVGTTVNSIIPPLAKGGEGGFSTTNITPKEVSKIRILDPACGSGSFFLGAYQYLLDWHRDWYAGNDPQKWAGGKGVLRYAPTIYQAQGGDWHLTTAEKKRILLNNIYGVDIDSQAVEVTKLSLLLKVLEGENNQTLERQLKFFHERALPDLGDNIKCGNSLIGSDFYEMELFKSSSPHFGKGGQGGILDDEERYRINVFDWNAEFPEIMKRGGFDAVIGNPPYIRIQALKEWAPTEVEFYKAKYVSAGKGNYDIYVVFVEKGLGLLNKNGRLGFILPSKFFTTDYGEGLRQLITQRKALSQVLDFGHSQVFKNATTYTGLLFLSGSHAKLMHYSITSEPSTLATTQPTYRGIESKEFSGEPWHFGTETDNAIVDKLYQNSTRLSDLPARIGRGSSSGDDDVFILRKKESGLTTRSGETVEVEEDILRVPLYATDFDRYRFDPVGKEVIIFPYNVLNDGYKLKSEAEMKKDFPKAYNYLASQRKALEDRKQFKAWYGFSAPRNLDVHAVAQILVPLLANKGMYCRLPDPAEAYCLMASGGFSITVSRSSRLSPNYVLGLLNSKLLFWRLRSISNKFRGGWITCTKQYVETLPIRNIDFAKQADKSHHDKMVSLVEQMLSLNKKLTAAKTDHEKTSLQRQVDATDRQIDRLVYELYGLTEEEIRIVENNQ